MIIVGSRHKIMALGREWRGGWLLVQLFRQPKPDDWDTIINEVSTTLNNI